MTRITPVRILDYAESARALIAANWAETGFDFEVQPDFETYQAMQDEGALFALAALDEGQVVGYVTAVVQPHLFNPQVVCCLSDALFVHPAYRAGTLGARLIAATEAHARRQGAVRMLWCTRAGTPLARVLGKRGYQAADMVVMKGL